MTRPSDPLPPRPLKRPVRRTVHGVEVTDGYAWLRADNWQDVLHDPQALPRDIREHLEAENAYADRILAPVEDLQRVLFAELKARLKPDDSGVPMPDGPFAYYSRFREGGQHPLICRQPSEGGQETVLLDGNALALGKAFFKLGDIAHSKDHARLAWSADDSGSEYYTLRVLDMVHLEGLADAVVDTAGPAVWQDDAASFLYVGMDDNHRPSRVFLHTLGTPAAEDRLIYEEPDPGFFVDISPTQSGRYAAISVHDHETSEVHLIDLADRKAAPRLIAAREAGLRYEIEHHPDLLGQDSLVILTNADGAEDFKIVGVSATTPDRANWREIVPHRPGVMILSFALFHDWLIRLERDNGLPRIVARELACGREHAIAFAEEAYSLSMDAGFEFNTDRLRFTYSSMTTPAETYDYDLRSRTRRLRKRQEIPSGHDPSAYVTRRLFAPAADGETVPISLLYAKTTPLDGSAPLFLYGYGAYGTAIPAAFSANALSLVNRGFIYAIAHIRGGTEKGWRWYREGKLEKKPNSFGDFLAAGQYLAHQGFTRRGAIVAHGASAGGMVMGALANMAPDLFAAIIAEVPFVDVLSTMLDDALPLTPPEWPEWGNPIASKAAFEAIRSYSPVDNVRRQAYPAILALAGLTDPRVTYWEPAKWVARLREVNTGAKPILLKVNMEAGHAGAAGRFDRLKEVALIHAFALMAVRPNPFAKVEESVGPA